MAAKKKKAAGSAKKAKTGDLIISKSRVKAAAKNQTQHVFRDLYRLQVARFRLAGVQNSRWIG